MSIIKKVNNKDYTIADNNIISHSQLSGTTDYNCHPISAIRKLPEKLHALKEKDDELQQRLDNSKETDNQRFEELEAKDKALEEKDTQLDEADAQLESEIREVEDNTKQINVTVDDNGNLTFTDYNNNSSTYKTGYLPDDDTLILVEIESEDNNTEKYLALNKAYTDDVTIIGKGTKDSPIELKNKPDEDTIITNTTAKSIYATAIKDDTSRVTPQYIRDQNEANEEKFTAVREYFEAEVEKINDYNKSQDDTLSDLLARTKGMGGFLNAYNFGANPSQDDLTNYALQDINITDPLEIFNGTKVKNLYDGHVWVLTNTPDSNPAVFEWEDQGVDTTISDANNDGVHGLVTGSYEEYEGFVDINGHISINGLKQKVDEINENIESNQNAIEKEIEDRQTADSEINSIITDEIKPSITQLQEDLEAETTRATEAETTIQTNLDNEVTARTTADSELQSNIDDLKSYTDETFATKVELEDLHEQITEEAVKADNTTLVKNEDTTLTVTGVEDVSTGSVKTAASLIQGTTVVILEDDDE